MRKTLPFRNGTAHTTSQYYVSLQNRCPFPQVRGDQQLVWDGNATSRTRGLYTPPSYGSQDDVEGLIGTIREFDYLE